MTHELIKTSITGIDRNKMTDLSTIRKDIENNIFDSMKDYSIEWAFNHYLGTLKSEYTKKNYQSGFYRLNSLGIIQASMSLQQFALMNLNNIVDDIKQIVEWSESTRQARAATFIAFTKFLERKTESVIKRATPSKEGTNRTFKKVRSKVKTDVITIAESKLFTARLSRKNKRDGLIAQLCLQGAKRIDEVLTATIDMINWEKGTIEFKQSKVSSEDSTIITFSETIMNDLRAYIADRKEGYIFVSRKGTKVHKTQLNRNFAEISKKVLGKHISPHTLRATAITEYKRRGFNYEDIQKISGHKTLTQLGEYDKTEKENNPSKETSLT